MYFYPLSKHNDNPATLSHGNGGIGLAIVRQTDTGNQSAELAPHVQFVNSTIAAPATARANIFRVFMSLLLS